MWKNPKVALDRQVADPERRGTHLRNNRQPFKEKPPATKGTTTTGWLRSTTSKPKPNPRGATWPSLFFIAHVTPSNAHTYPCLFLPFPSPLFFCKARPNPLIKIKIKKKKKKKNENHDLLHNLWSMKKKKWWFFFFWEKKFMSSCSYQILYLLLKAKRRVKLKTAFHTYTIYYKKIYLKTKRQQNNSWPLDS